MPAPGPVLLCCNISANKYEPLVDKVQVSEAKPRYVHVTVNDGLGSSVFVQDLAPVGNKYNRRERKIKEQYILVAKGAAEMEEPDSDIRSKLLSKPEIHLPVSNILL